MKCSDCGHEVTAADRFCPKCCSVIRPPSLWQRFVAMFQRRNSFTIVEAKKVATVLTTEIVTERGGERHVYHSIEELPPEQRAEIERLKAEALGSKAERLFKVRDA